MYLEDVDLCWRLNEAGWRISYEPKAEVLHVQGVSTDLHPYRMLVAHHRSLWLFARRTTVGAERLALPVVCVGLVARLAVAVIRRRLAGRVEPEWASRSPPASLTPCYGQSLFKQKGGARRWYRWRTGSGTAYALGLLRDHHGDRGARRGRHDRQPAAP